MSSSFSMMAGSIIEICVHDHLYKKTRYLLQE